MNNYITGKFIKECREKNNMTQEELSKRINVSDKTISKWETGRGLPDISLIEPLAEALKVSVVELMNGERITNKNKSGNIFRSVFHVCPVCGNVIYSMGNVLVSCCGITLPEEVVEEEDERHRIICQKNQNEYYVRVAHEMTKEHYISFIAYIVFDRCEIVKLYPEQNAEASFSDRGEGKIVVCCNKDGLFQKNLRRC